MIEKLVAENGLPLNVKYCIRCVESNQRFIGSAPHKDQSKSIKDTTIFDKEGICGACKYFEYKRTIDWAERERELIDTLDQFRKDGDSYDVLVPGSGGKDSAFTSHILKTKYGMNPLTTTWAPHMYTDIGWKNFQAWIHSGFDNILHTPNGQIHSKLTRLAFENLLHPFQPFVIGQYNLAPRVAMQYGIKLIIYGDYYPEKGVGSGVKFDDKGLDSVLYTSSENDDLFISGVPIEEMGRYGIHRSDLLPYMPLNKEKVDEADLTNLFLPYFLSYDPQRAYYYAVENTGFQVNPAGRTDGTYTKYQSLDDKIDGFHYYTWYIKTGRGRTTEDAALEIRNGHINREEGVALVKRYDGEFPGTYFKEFLNYTGLSEDEFWEIVDRYRAPHLWKKIGNEWRLKHQVS